MKPGQESAIRLDMIMHTGMDGPHLFEITVVTNDPVEPVKKLSLRAYFG